MSDSIFKDTWPPKAKRGMKDSRFQKRQKMLERLGKLQKASGASHAKGGGSKKTITSEQPEVQHVHVAGGTVFVVPEKSDLDTDHARLDARMQGILRKIIRELSPAAVGKALETPGPISALGVILDELIKERPDLVELDPVGEATARITAIHKALIKRAGGAYTTTEVAEMLGTSAGGVRKRIQRDALLAFKTASGGHRLPVAQFKAGGTIDGLEEVLEAMNVTDPWMRIQLFLDNDVLGSLRIGRVSDAVEAVRAYLPNDDGVPL